ncbi:hypothetical protein ACZ91_52045 [Streptomyces regensis]|nr:hypothetical protein ACZ91_52045 [Streptomyces regensis]
MIRSPRTSRQSPEARPRRAPRATSTGAPAEAAEGEVAGRPPVPFGRVMPPAGAPQVAPGTGARLSSDRLRTTRTPASSTREVSPTPMATALRWR